MSLIDRFPSFAAAFELVFPPSCPGCNQEVDLHPDSQHFEDATDDFWSRESWCSDCRQQLDAEEATRCETCAAILNQTSPYPDGCASCLDAKLPFDSTVSIHNYAGLLKKLVIRTKNQHDETLAAQLGRLLGNEVLRTHDCSTLDLIVPIPSHWRRQLKTGFHAANILAKSVSKTIGIDESRRILDAVKLTRKQGQLSRTARLSNVKNAFTCRSPSKVSGRTVLLVDDVMTSGATTAEASRVLRKAGAKRIVVAVVARATGLG